MLRDKNKMHTAWLFANEIDVLIESEIKVYGQINVWYAEAEKLGVKINRKKNKTMFLIRGEKYRRDVITIYGEESEEVKSFVYLWS